MLDGRVHGCLEDLVFLHGNMPLTGARGQEIVLRSSAPTDHLESTAPTTAVASPVDSVVKEEDATAPAQEPTPPVPEALPVGNRLFLRSCFSTL